MSTRTKKRNRRPRVLVLEGLYGTDECVRRSGGSATSIDPWNLEAADKALTAGNFDALLLTGGGDVDPRLYGEKTHKKSYGVNETRDLVELIALERAAELGVPVLGICRGAQIMNVEAGGTLIRHLKPERGHHRPHIVLTEPSSRLRRSAGKALPCQSHHHQSVRLLGAGFKTAALSKDGIIEAIESSDGLRTGVQFHPEMDYDRNPQSRDIFRAFVLLAARVAKLPVPTEQPILPKVWQTRYGSHPNATGKVAAGKRRQPKAKNPVVVSWLCPQCGILFDEQADREDHIAWVHGAPVINSSDVDTGWSDMGLETPPEPGRRSEPPADHPDWEPARVRQLTQKTKARRS